MVGRSTGTPSPHLIQRWRHALGPVAVGAALPLALYACHGDEPGHDVEALASALGLAAGGAEVDPQDIRWEPSRGVLGDLVLGRRVLYLARARGDGDDASRDGEPRDVWRSRVRVAPNGSVLQVADAYDLTNTPLGDDHELVVRGTRAAFATRAYGQEQSVTALVLDGEGAQNKAATQLDRAMAAVTNLQRTGSFEGVGRVDVTFESPGHAVALALDDRGLDIRLSGGDPRRATEAHAWLDLQSGELPSGDLAASAPSAAMRVEPVVHLPKRFSHWTVDTLRAVPWIGPVPIAWAEDRALALRDTYRRLTFASSGSATEIVAHAEPPPPILDTSEASIEEAHWPPPPIPTIWKSPEPGEGQWKAPDMPWLRRVPWVAADAPSPFYESFVRPDEERPYAKVLLVAMDMRQLDLQMEAGTEDPEPMTGPPGAGRIPRDPAVYRRVAAAFNGAFKTDHGHYGMMVHRRVLLPPVPNAASVVVLDDGRVGFGTWGADKRVGGLLGVPDDSIESFRQNLDALVDQGKINPSGRNLWGFTLPGKGAQTERSGVCVTKSGHLVYAWGEDLSGTTLARALTMAGCNFAMHLDMNPYHTGFLFASIDEFSGHKYKSALLSPAMSIQPDRYIQYSSKDFFYLLVHDPTPREVPQAEPWSVAPGTQPPPHWLPGIWSTRAGAGGAVELVDIESARASFHVRAGTDDAVASSPLRDFHGDEAGRVLLAVGLGVSPERRPLGLSTEGRMAAAVRGGGDFGLLVTGAGGGLTMTRADEGGAIDARSDLVELPIVLWNGKRIPAPISRMTDAGTVIPRAALGLTPNGRVILARGSFGGYDELAEALASAGCTRALALDRGAKASAFLDRAGTESPPRERYAESVLYATGVPLMPRAFRFEAAPLVAQAHH
ncbi:MAG: phosphodiester glycosidase family protein [Polyangiaceae bacterium]|nr:phosphodiester glycosidase family protein [Polyangiaceae bacterium]